MSIFTCKGCRNRSIEPNCHTYCEEYKQNKLKWDSISKQMKYDNDVMKMAYQNNIKRF